MANYYSPMVIQQSIPAGDLTALERLILSRIFECDGDDGDLYFFSHDGTSNHISIAADTLRAAIDDPAAQGTTALAQILDQYAEAILNDGEIEIDASGGWWDAILQDVVRRSDTLDHLSVITAFTCDKMRPDGFGGMATLITAQAIRGQSTYELIAEFIAEAVDEGEMKPLA